MPSSVRAAPVYATTAATSYTLDALDRPIATTVSDGASDASSYTNHDPDRTISQDPSQMGQISYSYDENGNVSQRTDPNGRQITFTYDNLDRLTRKTYSDGTAQVDYTFDDTAVLNSKGRLTRSLVTGGVEQAILGYDSLGRVTSSKQKHGAVEYPFFYTYNALNQPVTIQYPSERTYRFSYNASDATRLSQVDRITSPTNQTVEKIYAFITQYSPVGAPQLVQLGSSPALYQHTRYNGRLQLTNVKVGTNSTYTDAAAADRMALALAYGTNANNGNVLTQVTTLPGAAFSQTYNDDQVNRLCSVREQATATPLAAYSCTSSGALESGESWRQTFGYDRFGNQWVAQHLGANMPYSGLRPTTQSNFDANTNRLVESAGQVGYDATGNQTTHGGWTLAYDAEGRIKTATPSSGNAATYEYDGDGRRVKKTVGTTATWFVYDVSGQLAAEYTVAGPTGSPETHYLTTDHLGSTRLVTNQSAAVVSSHDYLPFGAEIPNNLGGRSTSLGYLANANLTHRFTGKERDTETTLDYFGARYLSSAQGRWTSPDNPLLDQDPSDPRSWNLYGYARSNPLRFVDPNGQAIVEACTEEGRCYYLDDKNFIIKDGQVYAAVSGNIVRITSHKAVFDDFQSEFNGILAAAFTMSQLDSPAPGPADVIALGTLTAGAILMSINKDTKAKIEGLLGTALEHLSHLEGTGKPDPNGDNRPGWRKEVRAALDRVERLAKRLPRASQEKTMEIVRQLRGRLGEQ